MPMKELNGSEVVGFIKERQLHEVRALVQAHHILPKLAIIRTNQNRVVDVYMKLKKAYGADVGVLVEVFDCSEHDAHKVIAKLNADPSVHGIVVQLPLGDVSQTDELLNSVAPEKDVDGLGESAVFAPATPTAIMWLLAAYNTDLGSSAITIMGQGRLVGAPLGRMLKDSGYSVTLVDETTPNTKEITLASDVIITAVGKPEVLTSDMVQPGATVIDAGVATDANGFVGDIADDVREVRDVRVTPKRGGVGPLTIAALFENVITAAKGVML